MAKKCPGRAWIDTSITTLPSGKTTLTVFNSGNRRMSHPVTITASNGQRKYVWEVKLGLRESKPYDITVLNGSRLGAGDISIKVGREPTAKLKLSHFSVVSWWDCVTEIPVLNMRISKASASMDCNDEASVLFLQNGKQIDEMYLDLSQLHQKNFVELSIPKASLNDNAPLLLSEKGFQDFAIYPPAQLSQTVTHDFSPRGRILFLTVKNGAWRMLKSTVLSVKQKDGSKDLDSRTVKLRADEPVQLSILSKKLKQDLPLEFYLDGKLFMECPVPIELQDYSDFVFDDQWRGNVYTIKVTNTGSDMATPVTFTVGKTNHKILLQQDEPKLLKMRGAKVDRLVEVKVGRKVIFGCIVPPKTINFSLPHEFWVPKPFPSNFEVAGIFQVPGTKKFIVPVKNNGPRVDLDDARVWLSGGKTKSPVYNLGNFPSGKTIFAEFSDLVPGTRMGVWIGISHPVDLIVPYPTGLEFQTLDNGCLSGFSVKRTARGDVNLTMSIINASSSCMCHLTHSLLVTKSPQPVWVEEVRSGEMIFVTTMGNQESPGVLLYAYEQQPVFEDVQ